MGTLAQSIAESKRKIDSEIEKVLEEIRSWNSNDPVLTAYRGLFDTSVIQDIDIDEVAFKREVAERIERRDPPGYKDVSKASNSAGDLLIWKTVLKVATERDSDATLVSSDHKSDWWHIASGSPLYPRVELVEEFRRKTNGKTFAMVTLGQLLEDMKVAPDVVAEVRLQEVESTIERDIKGTNRFSHYPRSRKTISAVRRYFLNQGWTVGPVSAEGEFDLTLWSPNGKCQLINVLPVSSRTQKETVFDNAFSAAQAIARSGFLDERRSYCRAGLVVVAFSRSHAAELNGLLQDLRLPPRSWMMLGHREGSIFQPFMTVSPQW